MKYPKELVDRYGAKAGILIYVKEHLPHIPQVDMIVKTPDEPTDSALVRADQARILWPRLFRSSAIEELVGYEGMFPTVVVEGLEDIRRDAKRKGYRIPLTSQAVFDKYVREEMRRVQQSPRELKQDSPEHAHLPDDISVIIAEQSPSSITGTLVKHPNQQEYYVISASVVETLNRPDPEHSAYTWQPHEGVQSFSGFDKKGIETTRYVSDQAKRNVRREITQVVSWHDAIVALPEMDADWTYQIEFGLDPVCLYQVRPFKKRAVADFKLKHDPMERQVVFGVTSEEGLLVRIEENVWKRYCADEIINSDNAPAGFYGELRDAHFCDYIPNLNATILTRSSGLLAHNDIRAIRRSDVSVLFSDYPNEDRNIKQGDWIRIISDGNSVKLVKE